MESTDGRLHLTWKPDGRTAPSNRYPAESIENVLSEYGKGMQLHYAAIQNMKYIELGVYQMDNLKEKESLSMQRTALIILDLQNGIVKGRQLAPIQASRWLPTQADWRRRLFKKALL